MPRSTTRWLGPMMLVAWASIASAGTPSVRGDVGGVRRITYATFDGTVDSEWLYVAAGPPGAPLVVLAHGQGVEHVVNCAPEEVPHDGTVKQAVALADRLAAGGVSALVIMYRNAGDGQARLPAVRLRDTGLRDAAAVLAAARAVRDARGVAGDVPVALLGASNGTFAAWWAATDRVELRALQAGLAIRTVVLAGHTANALANLVALRPALTAAGKSARQSAILGGVLLGVQSAIAASSRAEVNAAELNAGGAVAQQLAPLLTTDGIAAFRAAWVTPVAHAAGRCRAGLPAACDTGCLASALAAASDPGAVTRYVRAPVIEAIEAWDPEHVVDPGPDASNPIIAVARASSPPFYAGHVRTPRALVLYSSGDHVVVPHGEATRNATIAALRRQGAAIPASPSIDHDARGVCEHESYWEPGRACGFSALIAELTAAFATP